MSYIDLSQGKQSIVHDEDHEWLSDFTWNGEKADEPYGAVLSPQIVKKLANEEVGR